jgi:hypothetical protein
MRKKRDGKSARVLLATTMVSTADEEKYNAARLLQKKKFASALRRLGLESLGVEFAVWIWEDARR